MVAQQNNACKFGGKAAEFMDTLIQPHKNKYVILKIDPPKKEIILIENISFQVLCYKLLRCTFEVDFSKLLSTRPFLHLGATNAILGSELWRKAKLSIMS